MNSQLLQEVLEDMASEVEDGVIVELGTHHGAGTIALCKGAKRGHNVDVYTIDDFADREGWTGEKYRKHDKKKFIIAMTFAEQTAILIEKDFSEASIDFMLPIGLWYWDPGVKHRFADDWLSWSPNIIVGGYAVIKDTAHGDLGATEYIQLILLTGSWQPIMEETGITILKRLR